MITPERKAELEAAVREILARHLLSPNPSPKLSQAKASPFVMLSFMSPQKTQMPRALIALSKSGVRIGSQSTCELMKNNAHGRRPLADTKNNSMRAVVD